MYCRRCGYQLENETKFCTRCGAQVDSGDVSFEMGENPAPSVSPVTLEAVRDTADCERPDRTSSTNDSTESPLNSFTKVMDDAKKKSRVRMRVVVIATLAALLLSGVAYAAYYVYTRVVQPQQDVQVATTESPEVFEEQKNTYTYTMAKIENEATTKDPYFSFSYPVFSSSMQNLSVEELNERFKQEAFGGYARRGKEYEMIDDGQYLKYDIAVSYQRENIVALRTEKYATHGGPHGEATVKGSVVNLDTGKISAPEAFFQIDKNDLKLRTTDALREYTKNNPNKGYWSDLDKAITETVESETLGYYLTDEGLVVETRSYSLGGFAIGPQIALVIPFGEIPESL